MTPNEWQVVEQLYATERPSGYPDDLKAALGLLHNRLPQDTIDRWHEPSEKLQGVLKLIDGYRSFSDEQIEEYMKPPDPSERLYLLSDFIEELRRDVERDLPAGRSSQIDVKQS